MKKRSCKSMLKIMTVISVIAIQVMGSVITAYAYDSEFTETDDLYEMGTGDYLLAGRYGYFLSNTNVYSNDDDPYPYGSSATAGTKVESAAAEGDYYSGHVFDCSYDSVNHTYVENLRDPVTLGEPLGTYDFFRLEYNSTDKNYTISLHRNEAPAPDPEPEPVPVTDSDPEPEPTPEPIKWEEPVKEVEEPATSNEITVISTNVGETLPTAELGNAVAPTKTVAIDLFRLTPLQYTNAVKDTITTASAGGAIVIVTNQVACLNKSMMEALATRPDVSLNIVFSNNGKKYRVTIPAGYDVMSLLDSNGYCGYLHLADVFGSTELD